MHLQKDKDYSIISLDAVKQHLRLVDDEDDTYVEHLIKASVNAAENYIQQSIVPTQCTLTDYFIYGNYYSIPEPDAIITGITATTASGQKRIVTDYKVYNSQSATYIKFATSLNAEVLTIQFSCGSTEIPADVLAAIYIKIGELFDADRSGLMPSNVKESKTFQRLLTPYMNFI